MLNLVHAIKVGQRSHGRGNFNNQQNNHAFDKENQNNNFQKIRSKM